MLRIVALAMSLSTVALSTVTSSYEMQISVFLRRLRGPPMAPMNTPRRAWHLPQKSALICLGP